MNIKKIKQILKNKFNNDFIEVIDINGQENHFSIIVISNQFNNLNLIERHRIIYDLFSKELTNEIHALQIKTYTAQEWKLKNN
tara:strand:- start:224 stop:472 length:249 start_codon:yes stop_codon:yes gene_type:complete